MEIMFIRTILLFIISTTILRLMGKRQLGELEPYEVVITIIIAELATTPMEDVGISLLYGIFPIITLYIAHTIMSYLSLKFLWIRRLICGKETVIIDHGKLLIENMRQNFLSMDELMEQLRGKNVFDINEVDYAILESSGTISVLKKPRYKTPNLLDMKIKPSTDQHLPITVITCGKFQKCNKIEKQDFIKKIAKKGYKDYKKVFYASISSDNMLFIQAYDAKSEIIDLGELK